MTGLLPLDSASLAAWLAQKRWFRSRARSVRDVIVHDSISLPNDDGALLVLLASFADGGTEHYLVPVVMVDGPPREATEGDGVWRSLATLLADGPRSVSGSRGGLAFEPGPALPRLAPGGSAEIAALAERAMGVDQSNTSVRLGDRLMLKLYRMLEPGSNPEVQVMELLTERDFASAPLCAGSIRYLPDDGAPGDAAILQALVPAQGDAWSWMLGHLDGPVADPEAAIAAASRIGAVTAALHAALQSDPDRPDFPSRPATTDERHGWRTAAQRELDAAQAAMSEADRDRLAHLAEGARAGFEALTEAPAAWTSRIHGDYHLGQLLVTDEGFVITDFEGEPARPLAERRQPASPLRDVAGMLRSLDYAARTVQRGQPNFDADNWLAAARTAFLTAYGEPVEPSLLRAFELEKACYEVRYEANFRPDWVWLPLEAIERMVA